LWTKLSEFSLLLLQEIYWQTLGFKRTFNAVRYPFPLFITYPLLGIVVPPSNRFFVNAAAFLHRYGHPPISLVVDDGVPSSCAHREPFIAVDSPTVPESSPPEHRGHPFICPKPLSSQSRLYGVRLAWSAQIPANLARFQAIDSAESIARSPHSIESPVKFCIDASPAAPRRRALLTRVCNARRGGFV
jgi:hypothetical protein